MIQLKTARVITIQNYSKRKVQLTTAMVPPAVPAMKYYMVEMVVMEEMVSLDVMDCLVIKDLKASQELGEQLD